VLFRSLKNEIFLKTCAGQESFWKSVPPLHSLSLSRARTHTHRWKASFGMFRSSAVAFDLMASMGVKRVHSRPIFRVANSQKSLAARSGEYGGRMMTQQTKHCSVGYRDAEATVSACHSWRRFLSQMTSNTLSRRYEFMAHQTVMLNNSGNFLTALVLSACENVIKYDTHT
jgi:hypothetical protein